MLAAVLNALFHGAFIRPLFVRVDTADMAMLKGA